jgi:hypothetical protein
MSLWYNYMTNYHTACLLEYQRERGEFDLYKVFKEIDYVLRANFTDVLFFRITQY